LPSAPALGRTGTDTTHFSILDRKGNRVAGTMSINTWFGAAFMPPGSGVILNDEMDDFTIRAGTANWYDLVGTDVNAVAPGKRMLSSMSPTFLESDRGIAILGTPGGSRIITMVLLAALDWFDGGNAQSMVSLKRYHHQFLPDVVSYEDGAFTAEEIEGLKKRGHTLARSERTFGNMNVVTWDYAKNKAEAATDPRVPMEGEVY